MVNVFCCLQESKDPDKITTQAEQLDEYVDIGDEMPTATYQSVEIEKDTEAASSGSSSSSGTIELSLYNLNIQLLDERKVLGCVLFDFCYWFRFRELKGQCLRIWQCPFSGVRPPF
jgi:hypothetical protein